MKKITIFLILISTLFLMVVPQARAGKNYKNYFVNIVDEYGSPVSTVSKVKVLMPGTNNAAWIYLSSDGPTQTNPMTTGWTSGVVKFWTNRDSCDLVISVPNYPDVEIYGVTPYRHFVIIRKEAPISIVCERFLAPAALSTTGVTTTSVLDTRVFYSETVSTTVLVQPAYARNVTWVCTNPEFGMVSANPGNTAYLTVYGLDLRGNYVTENIQLATQTLTTNTNSGTGVVAFAKINTITFSTAALVMLKATGTNYWMGWGNKFGLAKEAWNDTFTKVVENAANVATTAPTYNSTYITVTPSGTPNATINFEYWYKVKN